jgi:hypothetical protein
MNSVLDVDHFEGLASNLAPERFDHIGLKPVVESGQVHDFEARSPVTKAVLEIYTGMRGSNPELSVLDGNRR